MQRRIKQGERTLLFDWWHGHRTRHAVQKEFVRRGYVKTLTGAKDRMLSLIERLIRDNKNKDDE